LSILEHKEAFLHKFIKFSNYFWRKTMTEEFIPSRNAQISASPIIATQALRMPVVAAACGNFSALNIVSNPVTQMQLRGFGNSTVSSTERSAFALHNYMADFDAVVQTRNADKVVLFAYSHTGYFATNYALGNPSSLRALILVEPALYTPKEELLKRIEASTRGEQSEAIEVMLRYVDPAVGMRANAPDVARTIKANVNNDMVLIEEFRIRAENPISDEQLGNLQIPVLLIGGTESRVNFVVKRAAQAIPYASVYWVRGATHLSLQDAEFADEIASAINTFLKHVQ
jgi:pimeloyl-ACP methyl ester carboxylesterase